MSYRPLPVNTSTTGPKVLTAAGVVLLIAAVAVGALVVRLFLSVLPTGIVGAEGAPGPDAVGGTEVPGSLTLELEGDSTYVVYLAHPSGAPEVSLTEEIEVTDPTGQEAATAATPSGSIDIRGVSARDVYALHTGEAGEYTVTAPPLTSPDATAWATIVVAPGDEIPAFFAGLFGTIAGVFLAIGLGVLGLIITVAGAIWWYLRRKDRRNLPPGTPQPGASPASEA